MQRSTNAVASLTKNMKYGHSNNKANFDSFVNDFVKPQLDNIGEFMERFEDVPTAWQDGFNMMDTICSKLFSSLLMQFNDPRWQFKKMLSLEKDVQPCGIGDGEETIFDTLNKTEAEFLSNVKSCNMDFFVNLTKDVNGSNYKSLMLLVLTNNHLIERMMFDALTAGYGDKCHYTADVCKRTMEISLGRSLNEEEIKSITLKPSIEYDVLMDSPEVTLCLHFLHDA